NPIGVAVDAGGSVYVSDYSNNKIRKITPEGIVTTFAGSRARGSTDASAGVASFNAPRGISLDSSGNVYVADSLNRKIRKITSAGVPDVTGTPTVSGIYDVNLTVSDGELSATQNYQITVADVNDAPELNDSAFALSENSVRGTTLGTLSASDEDGILASSVITGGETFTYSIVSGNTNSDFSINSTTGEITLAKELNAYLISTYSLTVKAVDDGGLSDSATITISVRNEVDAPVAVADSITSNEDTNATINLVSNDTDKDNNINIGSVLITKSPSNGSVTVNTSGIATYAPNQDYYGSDYFTYKIYDATSLESNEANVTISVTNVNDAPVVTNTTFSTDEDVNLTKALDMYAFDADGQSDITTYTLVNSGSNGTATLDGSLMTYNPDLNFYGFDTITFNVTDGNGTTSNTATLNINVAAINDIPVAYNDYDNNTTEESTITINVISNDTDDGTLDVTTVVIANNPSHGSVVVNGDGTVTYTPALNYNGYDSFEYTVKDDGLVTAAGGSTGVLISNVAVVTLNITSVNDAPIAVADSFTLDEDSVMLLNLIANDIDVDNDLNISGLTIVSQPTNGDANITSNGFVRYVPTKDYSGVDSFTYKISDGDINSNTVTVSLTVTIVNDAPSVATSKAQGIVENSTTPILIVARDIDDTNSSLSYSMLSGKDSSFFTFNTTSKELKFTTARNYEVPADANGDNIYDVDINVTDDSDGWIVRTFNVRIGNVSDTVLLIPPVIEVPVETEPETPIVELPVVTEPEVPVVTEPETPVVEVPNNQGIIEVVQDPTKLENTDGVTEFIVAKELITGVTLESQDVIQQSDNSYLTNIFLRDANGDSQAFSVKTVLEPIVTTTDEGIELQTVVQMDDGSQRDTISKIFINGTFQTTSTLTDSNGVVKTNILQSFLTDVAIETKADGTTLVNKTTTLEDASSSTVEGRITVDGYAVYSVTNTNNEGLEVETEATSQLNNSVITMREDGAVQINAQAKTLDGDTLLMVAEAQVDGTAKHLLKIIKSDGTEILISAISKVPGAKTIIASDGSITTYVTFETTQVEVSAFPNGQAQHIVRYNGFVSTVISKLAGANTVIEPNGDVITQSEVTIILNGETVDVIAKAITRKNGETLTEFERVLEDGTLKTISTTVSSQTPFEAGNTVTIEDDGELKIKVRTKLTRELVF
ncbi:tandem-95 repeat protein, partial [Sulfurimonas sp. SAG-AH-194-C21]